MLLLLHLEVGILLCLVVLLLLPHHGELHIRWRREAVGHGERVIGVKWVHRGAAGVGHTADLLPPHLIFI